MKVENSNKPVSAAFETETCEHGNKKTLNDRTHLLKPESSNELLEILKNMATGISFIILFVTIILFSGWLGTHLFPTFLATYFTPSFVVHDSSFWSQDFFWWNFFTGIVYLFWAIIFVSSGAAASVFLHIIGKRLRG